MFQLPVSARMGQVENRDNEQPEMNRQKQKEVGNEEKTKAGADVDFATT